jgi:hypothetical protein
MAYIWENYNYERRFEVDIENTSSYVEIWDDGGESIKVNVLKRFENIFFPEGIIKDSEDFKELEDKYKNIDKYKWISNILLHYLAQLDLLKGITRKEEMIQMKNKEVHKYLNDELNSFFLRLNQENQYKILNLLVEKEKRENRVSLFDTALKELFGTVQIYDDSYDEIIYIYVDAEENEYNQKMYELIKTLFKDMFVQDYVMWKNQHPGIIEIEKTMKIGLISVNM